MKFYVGAKGETSSKVSITLAAGDTEDRYYTSPIEITVRRDAAFSSGIPTDKWFAEIQIGDVFDLKPVYFCPRCKKVKVSQRKTNCIDCSRDLEP